MVKNSFEGDPACGPYSGAARLYIRSFDHGSYAGLCLGSAVAARGLKLQSPKVNPRLGELQFGEPSEPGSWFVGIGKGYLYAHPSYSSVWWLVPTEQEMRVATTCPCRKYRSHRAEGSQLQKVRASYHSKMTAPTGHLQPS